MYVVGKKMTINGHKFCQMFFVCNCKFNHSRIEVLQNYPAFFVVSFLCQRKPERNKIFFIKTQPYFTVKDFSKREAIRSIGIAQMVSTDNHIIGIHTISITFLGPSMSLPNNFSHQIYPPDLSVIFMVRHLTDQI